VRKSHPATQRDIKKSEGVNSLVLLATKEVMREFREDPIAMPLVLMYKGEVLVSNDMTPLPFGVSSVLQDFGDMFLEEVPAGFTRRKVFIYHDWHFWSLLKTPLLPRFRSVSW
jgi:hypothetical protein